MERHIGIVDEIDWTTSKAKIRVPGRDGFLNADSYQVTDSLLMRQVRTATDNLQLADIPRHMQGIRVGDIVLCLDDGIQNSDMIMLGFFGGSR